MTDILDIVAKYAPKEDDLDLACHQERYNMDPGPEGPEASLFFLSLLSSPLL